MKRIIFISLTLGFFSACNTSYIEENVPTKFPEGKALYMSKCSGCHRLHQRNEYTVTQWDSILVPMQKKSKINNEQKKQIRLFLTETYSARIEEKK